MPPRPIHRDLTRRERYIAKQAEANSMPLSVATVNFIHDENAAHLCRAASCFGARSLEIIGSIPDYDVMRSKSGTTNQILPINLHSNPVDFVYHCLQKDIELISVELCDEAKELSELEVNFDKLSCLVLGHEENGVPEFILKNSKQIVYIPMPGFGYCLNTAQAGNVALYHISQMWMNRNKK